ncbi:MULTISPECIES: FecR domain-containing protein [unclassified Sphingomonas]|nr:MULTISPECIES: FecR domain-containing protein [unclassified Sphingomonas]
MTGSTRQEINAQAAAWLARLHSEDRTPADVQGFQVWLAEDARHQETFESLTALWDASGEAEVHAARPAISRRAIIAGGCAVAMASIAGGIILLNRPGTQRFETAIGEQERLVLSDGSRLMLDADTQVAVSMGEQRRSINLIRGRANFIVSKDPLRPFVVAAGSREVIAVGTAFDVARQGDLVSVTMVEGKVLVRRPGAPDADRMLVAGDRLRMAEAATSYVADRPEIVAATAWQTGRAVFDNDTLEDAVTELNRYQPRQLIIRDPGVGALRISGSYQTGDSEAFARSIAELLPVRVSETEQGIVVSRR